MWQKMSQSDERNNNKCIMMHNKMQKWFYFFSISGWFPQGMTFYTTSTYFLFVETRCAWIIYRYKLWFYDHTFWSMKTWDNQSQLVQYKLLSCASIARRKKKYSTRENVFKPGKYQGYISCHASMFNWKPGLDFITDTP